MKVRNKRETVIADGNEYMIIRVLKERPDQALYHAMQNRKCFLISEFISIPVTEFDVRTISFTYGDSHPTFSNKITDEREYRKKLYTYDEILQIIDKYGYPQEWNSEGKYGPERYIEAHIWSDEVIEKYSLCVAEKFV